MKKILVIFTGGTIGSHVENGVISTDSSKYELISLYEKKHGHTAEFETANPYTILSENLTGTTLRMLVAAVREKLFEGFDGIIITHGSDTLLFSGAALYFALGPVEIPVLVVASNYVLTDKRANGQTNFSTAVSYINEGKKPGVYIAYDGIHHPAFIQQHLTYEDRLIDIPETELPVDFAPKIVDNLPAESHVLWIRIHPGMDYFIPEETKAVLIESYHSGTLPTDFEKFQNFASLLKEKKIPIYLVGAKAGDQYESCAAYEELGIRSLPQISPVAAYIWLWLYK